MLPEDFSRTGLHVSRRNGPPPARFQVLGERSTGTNLVKRLVARNTGLHPTEALGWKHGLAQAVWVMVDVRQGSGFRANVPPAKRIRLVATNGQDFLALHLNFQATHRFAQVTGSKVGFSWVCQSRLLRK